MAIVYQIAKGGREFPEDCRVFPYFSIELVGRGVP